MTSNQAFIPLIRSCYFNTYLDYIEAYEPDLLSLAEKAGLPKNLRELSAREYISIEVANNFLRVISEQLGSENTLKMHQACLKKNVLIQSEGITPTGSVLDALKELCEKTRYESTDSSFELEARLGYHWYHRKRTNEATTTDVIAVLNMIYHVQLLLGEEWFPKEVTIRSRHKGLFKQVFKDKDVTVSTGERFTGIFVPDSVLTKAISAQTQSSVKSDYEMVHTFKYSLKLLLQPYLGDHIPTIEEAAQHANMSVRTLQRRLAKEESAYSEITQELRDELICDYLINTRLSISQISSKMGYSYPTHMTRAFKKTFELTPREFRERYKATE